LCRYDIFFPLGLQCQHQLVPRVCQVVCCVHQSLRRREKTSINTYSNRRVANHLHGLIFELKERMNSRQDRPVMQLNEWTHCIINTNKEHSKIVLHFTWSPWYYMTFQESEILRQTEYVKHSACYIHNTCIISVIPVQFLTLYVYRCTIDIKVRQTFDHCVND